MSLDAIKKISEVEKQAEDLVNQAKSQARERASDAQKAVQELRSRLIAEENQSIQEAVAKAAKDSEAKAKASVEKAYAECDEIAAGAMVNMPAAISLIVGRVVKG